MLEMRSMASFIVWLRGVCARGRWCINSCYPGDAYNPHSGPHSEGMRIVRGCEEWLCAHMAEWCEEWLCAHMAEWPELARCGAEIGCVCAAVLRAR